MRLIQGIWGGIAIAIAVLLGQGIGRLDDSGRRQKVIEAAIGEMPAPNVKKYWKDVLGPNHMGPYPPYWCGAFALWALHAAGIGLALRWIIGIGFLSNLRVLRANETPKVADIAYFSDLQHHALIERVDGSNLHLINGNAEGGSIKRNIKHRSKVTAVYSIESLLS